VRVGGVEDAVGDAACDEFEDFLVDAAAEVADFGVMLGSERGQLVSSRSVRWCVRERGGRRSRASRASLERPERDGDNLDFNEAPQPQTNSFDELTGGDAFPTVEHLEPGSCC
jgi:hypothetical protein